MPRKLEARLRMPFRDMVAVGKICKWQPIQQVYRLRLRLWLTQIPSFYLENNLIGENCVALEFIYIWGILIQFKDWIKKKVNQKNGACTAFTHVIQVMTENILLKS